MKKNKLIAGAISLLMLFSFVPAAFAAGKITSCVDLSHVRKNEHGDGWVWDNINDILTLTDLHIETADDYGLRLPEVCTIVLNGDNYISAKAAAITFSGSAEIKGSGSLTLVGGETGIWNYSQLTSDSVRFLEGKYSITAGSDGMKSQTAALMLVGGTFDIDAHGGNAISGRTVRLMQTKLTAKGSIYASYDLTLRDADVTVEADKSALMVGDSGKLTLADVILSAGETAKTASPAKEYSGEKAIVTKADGNRLGESAIFGKNCPKFVDYIVILAAVCAVSAVIIVPILIKKKKSAEALKRSEEYIAREDAEYKAERKNRRR